MIELSRETEALARRLAHTQRLSVDATVRRALEAHAVAAGLRTEPDGQRDQSPEAAAARRERIEQIVREIAATPILDNRSPNEIIDDINAL